jgi:alpha-aminoadipic semialdehyde synthase
LAEDTVNDFYRAPLSPEQVRRLIDTHSFRVIVQPSSLRIFSDDDYIKAGATVSDDLSEACLIIGIKKMACGSILPDKSYMFFGHVIKAQKSNVDVLDKLLVSQVSAVSSLSSCSVHIPNRSCPHQFAFHQ